MTLRGQDQGAETERALAEVEVVRGERGQP